MVAAQVLAANTQVYVDLPILASIRAEIAQCQNAKATGDQDDRDHERESRQKKERAQRARERKSEYRNNSLVH